MSQLTGKGAFFRLPLFICEKIEILDLDGKMNCINCAKEDTLISIFGINLGEM